MNIINITLAGRFLGKINLISIISILIYIFLPSCKNNIKDKSEDELWEQALMICNNSIILDSHIDWPERIHVNHKDISKEINEGDFDLVRARKGGLNAALSVVYIDPSYGVKEGRIMVDSLLQLVTGYPDYYPDKFALARTPDEIKNNFDNGLFSLPLCLENGAPIGDDLGYLKYLKGQGIVYITLNHGKVNQIGDSSYDTIRTWNGLSPFGQEVIIEMNRLGIMIDISHSTDSAVFQALRHSKAPIIASHSSCRHFTPGFERNLSDTLIQAIADKNGIVMQCFGSRFLDSICMKNINNLIKLRDSTATTLGSKEGIDFVLKYRETHNINSNSKIVADHIDHMVNLVGIDYVGIGSDYDGIGLSQPLDLPDVSSYPVLVFELLNRGYSENDIIKILSENFLRVWNDIIEIADSSNNI